MIRSIGGVFTYPKAHRENARPRRITENSHGRAPWSHHCRRRSDRHEASTMSNTTRGRFRNGGSRAAIDNQPRTQRLHCRLFGPAINHRAPVATLNRRLEPWAGRQSVSVLSSYVHGDRSSSQRGRRSACQHAPHDYCKPSNLLAQQARRTAHVSRTKTLRCLLYASIGANTPHPHPENPSYANLNPSNDIIRRSAQCKERGLIASDLVERWWNCRYLPSSAIYFMALKQRVDRVKSTRSSPSGPTKFLRNSEPLCCPERSTRRSRGNISVNVVLLSLTDRRVRTNRTRKRNRPDPHSFLFLLPKKSGMVFIRHLAKRATDRSVFELVQVRERCTTGGVLGSKTPARQ